MVVKGKETSDGRNQDKDRHGQKEIWVLVERNRIAILTVTREIIETPLNEPSNPQSD